MSQLMIAGFQGCGFQPLSKTLSKAGIDFQEFIPEIGPARDDGRFILFYARPEYCMAQEESLTPDTWLAGARTLLRFIHSSRNHSLLLDVEQCLKYPVDFIRAASQFSGVSLDRDISVENEKALSGEVCCARIKALSNLLNRKDVEAAYNDLFVTAVALGDAQYLPAHERMGVLSVLVESIVKDLAEEGELLKTKNREHRRTFIDVNQLQEELETTRGNLLQSLDQLEEKAYTEIEISGLKEELNATQKELGELGEKIDELEKDKELSLLQINQLKEELEYYYNKYKQLKDVSDSIRVKDLPGMICPGRGLSVLASRAEIKGSSEMENCSNLEVCLYNLILADGRHFPQLSFKLVVNSGCTGVEFRQQEGVDFNYVRWPETMKDKLGPYLLVIPNPVKELAQEQQTLWESLRASDYNLLEGVLQAVNSMWDKNIVGNPRGLNDSKLRFWKLTASDCLDQLVHKPATMRYDQAFVKGQHQDKDYEHLWLAFRNLRLGGRFFKKYDFKLQASNLGGRKTFARHMSLSFKEIEEEQAPPLSFWPPDQVDDIGAQLVYHLDFKKAEAGLECADRLPEDDVEMIKLLVHTLPSVLGLVELPVGEAKRPLDQWRTLADFGRQIQIKVDRRKLGRLSRFRNILEGRRAQ